MSNHSQTSQSQGGEEETMESSTSSPATQSSNPGTPRSEVTGQRSGAGTPRLDVEVRNTPPPSAFTQQAQQMTQMQGSMGPVPVQLQQQQQHQQQLQAQLPRALPHQIMPQQVMQQTQPQSKYAHLLAVIEDMGKDIRPTYAGSKTSAERLKRGIVHARILVRECLMECERSARS